MKQLKKDRLDFQVSTHPMTWIHCLLDPLLEECFDISEWDEDQILAFPRRDEETEFDDGEEDLYYPPDSDGNIFVIFDNDEAL